MNRPPVIGIDLGTWHSCVAVFQNDKVDVISNDQGNRTTPSVVSFADSEILVGEDARNRGAKHSENTVFDVKRLIGRQFNNEKLMADLPYLTNKLIGNQANQANIEINFKETIRKLNPEVILSMVLKKMKQEAEVYMKRRCADTVISVPNYFNESQRQLIRDSCELSGLNLLKLTNETSLIGLAYQFEKRLTTAKNLFIFDMGAGFLNVSVLHIDNNRVEVKAASGNCDLGGRDFDHRLVEYMLDEFKAKHNVDLSATSKRAVYRLRNACEKAKHELSLAAKTSIDLDAISGDIDFSSSITRERFEEINVDLFSSIIDLCKKCLNDSKCTKTQIDEIVLVGGSSRIPKVQQILKEFFGKELNKSLNSDEAVACGAAVQAALLTGDKSNLLQDLKLVDVAPLTLGVETSGGIMASMIKRNTVVPTRVSRVFTTRNDNQPSVLVKLFEGDGIMTRNNTFLGSYELTGIGPMPKATIQIEISLEIDSKNTLSLAIVNKTNGISKKVTTADLTKHNNTLINANENNQLKEIELLKKTN